MKKNTEKQPKSNTLFVFKSWRSWKTNKQHLRFVKNINKSQTIRELKNLIIL